MTRSFADARRWQRDGTELVLATVDGLSDDDLAAGSALPHWTRRHVVAHLAANADALVNLVRWAATGVETPMYASPEARVEGIESGIRRATDELVAWLHESAATLESEMSVLTPEQWASPIRTAQGRTVPADEIPWLRDREVFVHAVDLDSGVGFADLPEDFLEALRDDIALKRGGSVPPVSGRAADVTAWMAGRQHGPVLDAGGAAVAPLGAWL